MSELATQGVILDTDFFAKLRREGKAPAKPQWLGGSLALPITNQFNELAISEACRKNQFSTRQVKK